MAYADWVSLAGQTVRLDQLRGNPVRYERLLAHARAGKDAHCLCRPAKLPLVVRFSQGGRHHLACWPMQGPEHDRRCAFFQLERSLNARRAYTRAAITESESVVALNLSVPLKSRPGSASALVRPPAARAGAKHQTVGLLGALHFLWEVTRLTHWAPDSPRRDWGTVAAALGEQLQVCTLSGQRGAEVVYVVPPYDRAAGCDSATLFDAFLGRMQTKDATVRRGLVLGEIRQTCAASHGVSYRLAHQSSRRQIFASLDFDARLRRSFRHAVGQAAAGCGGRQVALFCIERSRSGYAVAVDAAVMLTNGTYIPADSSHEVQMADALQRAGRPFVKPLVYDARNALVLPDFVLTDQPRTYVEVWGLPGRQDYELRKQRKLEHYQKYARQLIEWTVTDPMPSLA